ncbi:DUF4951 domain-containing protein [Caldilinea sp.]|uniref:DUF4951 domain-containing protein n=1 Tax=Caldilinea sp. TaxID=2293560 RepID=UPI002FDCDD14
MVWQSNQWIKFERTEIAFVVICRSTMKLAELKALAGEEFGRAFEQAQARNDRLPPPPTPGGECLAAFGKKLQWRTGNAAARAAAQRLCPQKLAEHALRADLAAMWALFYINEKFRNRRNPSAAGRAHYLVAAAKLLTKERAY